MESLFNNSVNKYTLWFLSKDTEAKYDKKTRELSQTHDKIGTWFLFCFIVVNLVLVGIELYYSIKGIGRFQFIVEIINLILYFTCLSIEGIFLLLDKLRFFKGSLLMISIYIVTAEYCRAYTASTFSLTPITLPTIAASLYIGISYNKSWIISTISTTLGTIYFTARFLTNVSGTILFQNIIFIIGMGTYEIFAFSIFYYNEICLRKNFFSGELMEGKKSSIKEILNMVPVPMVQRKNEKISFLNKSIKELLGITNNEDMEIKQLNKPEREKEYMKYLSKIKNTEDNNSLITLMRNFSTNQISDKILLLEKFNEKLKFRVCAIEFINVKSKIQIFVLEDLTYIERIQNETKNKYQKIMVASFSHDLLTPINGCLGLIDTLLYTSGESWVIKKLTIIKNSCLKLTFYVSLLKYFALIEGNSLSLDNSVFNCIDVIKECYTLFLQDVKKKKLKIITKFQSNKLFVNFDRLKFRQIIFALIENAEKHTFKGNISIEVSIQANEIDFVVIDTGIGIHPQNLEHVFELYGSSNSSNELNPQGIGLSLYVCKKLALFMGGEITVSSRENEETQFILKLSNNILTSDLPPPLQEPPPHSHEEEEEEKEEEKDFTERNLIGNQQSHLSEIISVEKIHECNCSQYLIVDDDPTNILVLKEYLKSMKKTCDIAFNGTEAVDKVVKKKSSNCCKNYKLIVMDINMPIMDGEEATRAIRKVNKTDSESQCIIIGLTAAQIQDQAHKERFLKAGFDDIFSKPMPRKQFKKIVDQYS